MSGPELNGRSGKKMGSLRVEIGEVDRIHGAQRYDRKLAVNTPTQNPPYPPVGMWTGFTPCSQRSGVSHSGM